MHLKEAMTIVLEGFRRTSIDLDQDDPDYATKVEAASTIEALMNGDNANCALKMLATGGAYVMHILTPTEVNAVSTVPLTERAARLAIEYVARRNRGDKTTQQLLELAVEVATNIDAGRRIIAACYPQTYNGAVVLDQTSTPVEVDVTDEIVRLGREVAIALSDDAYETDDIIPLDVRSALPGYFRVVVRSQVLRYFQEPAENAFDLFDLLEEVA